MSSNDLTWAIVNSFILSAPELELATHGWSGVQLSNATAATIPKGRNR
jgi:hypothetical protein